MKIIRLFDNLKNYLTSFIKKPHGYRTFNKNEGTKAIQKALEEVSKNPPKTI